MDAGAAGVMVAPPGTLRGDDAILGYCREVGELLGPVPWVLQDFPLAGGPPMSAGLVRRIAEACPNMVVLKHEDWPGLDKITAIRRPGGGRRAPPVDPVRPWRHPPAARARARCRRRHDRLLLPRDAGRRLPADARGPRPRRPSTSTTATCRWSATSSSPASASPCASTCCGGAAPWPRPPCGRRRAAERRDPRRGRPAAGASGPGNRRCG